MISIEYKHLEDVNVSGIYPPPDPGIVNLLRALRSVWLRTDASCEGHLDGRRNPFPWVGTSDNWVAKKILAPILDEYNRDHEIQWRLGNYTLEPVTRYDDMTDREAHFRELQESAEYLALYIFSRRK